MYRVPQFLEKCGNISDVNCQPVEKITTDSHGCFIMAHEKVAGTPDTQFRSWRKKMESCKVAKLKVVESETVQIPQN